MPSLTQLIANLLYENFCYSHELNSTQILMGLRFDTIIQNSNQSMMNSFHRHSFTSNKMIDEYHGKLTHFPTYIYISEKQKYYILLVAALQYIKKHPIWLDQKKASEGGNHLFKGNLKKNISAEMETATSECCAFSRGSLITDFIEMNSAHFYTIFLSNFHLFHTIFLFLI